MIEYYYSLLLLIIGTIMFVYSRSIPVVLVSIYISSWFFPLGLLVFGFGLPSYLIVGEILYMIYLSKGSERSSNSQLLHDTTKYMLYLIAFFIVIALFSTEIPFLYQLDSLKRYVYYLFNILFIVYSLRKSEEFQKIVHLILFILIMSGIYSAYTYITKDNPYALAIVSMTDIFDETGLDNSYIDEQRGFMTGRISGFTVHPLMYGGVLALSLFLLLYVFIQNNHLKGKIFYASMVLVTLILIVFTGSRSILIGTLTGLFVYVYKLFGNKVIVYSVILFSIISIGGLAIEDEFIKSTIFFWEDNSEIKGSSTEMRTNQIEAAYDRISDNAVSLAFGLGEGWVAQYSQKNGCIPPFMGFESIFIIAILQYGILGTLAYLFLLFGGLYKTVVRYVTSSKKQYLLVSYLIAGFVIYSFTGEAYGLRLYIILAFFMIKWYESANYKEQQVVKKELVK